MENNTLDQNLTSDELQNQTTENQIIRKLSLIEKSIDESIAKNEDKSLALTNKHNN